MQLSLFDQSFKRYNKLIFFDLETTGFIPTQEDIIELGLVVVDPHDDFRVTKMENLLVKASKPLPEKIIELTNITDAMLLNDGVAPEVLHERLHHYLNQDALWLAYNMQFDLSFLMAFMKRFNPTFKFTRDILDVMAVYKDYNVPPHRLMHAIERYNITFENTHRALDDVLATVEVFKALMRETDVTPYINVIGYHDTYGLKGPKLPHVRYFPQKNERESLKNALLK